MCINCYCLHSLESMFTSFYSSHTEFYVPIEMIATEFVFYYHTTCTINKLGTNKTFDVVGLQYNCV